MFFEDQDKDATDGGSVTEDTTPKDTEKDEDTGEETII